LCFNGGLELVGTFDLHSSISSKLVTISIMNYKSNLDHAHCDIEFIYVIKGNLQVKVNNEILLMNNSDFLLVNSNELHSFQSEKDNLFVIVHLNYSELSSLLGQKNLFFTCDSIGHSSQSDPELRNVIEEILVIYMKQNNDVYVEYL
jgi:xylan 1,4-beta-xylosidase